MHKKFGIKMARVVPEIS